MKKVLLIGGSGFLGSRLLKELQQSPFEIFAVIHRKSLPENKNLHLIKGGISAITTDLINELQPEIIFHCARPVFPRFKKLGRFIAAWSAYRKNKQFLNNLKHSVCKPLLVFASGSLMYGNSANPHDENSELHPISYARQYYRGEIPILNALLKNEYPVKIIRFPWLLGDGSWFAWLYLKSIIQHNSIPVFGDGGNMMEIVDVEDAAKLLLSISTSSYEKGIFNIPSQKAISQNEFLQEIVNLSGVKTLDFEQLFTGKLEKETVEAACSNIQLTTSHKEIFNNFSYTPLEISLKKIIQEKRPF